MSIASVLCLSISYVRHVNWKIVASVRLSLAYSQSRCIFQFPLLFLCCLLLVFSDFNLCFLFIVFWCVFNRLQLCLICSIRFSKLETGESPAKLDVIGIMSTLSHLVITTVTMRRTIIVHSFPTILVLRQLYYFSMKPFLKPSLSVANWQCIFNDDHEVVRCCTSSECWIYPVWYTCLLPVYR